MQQPKLLTRLPLSLITILYCNPLHCHYSCCHNVIQEILQLIYSHRWQKTMSLDSFSRLSQSQVNCITQHHFILGQAYSLCHTVLVSVTIPVAWCANKRHARAKRIAVVACLSIHTISFTQPLHSNSHLELQGVTHQEVLGQISFSGHSRVSAIHKDKEKDKSIILITLSLGLNFVSDFSRPAVSRFIVTLAIVKLSSNLVKICSQSATKGIQP